MASTSCNEIARELLDCCLRGERWPRPMLETLVRDECSDALFRIVVEGLADRFEPALCDTYVELFSEAIALAMPGAQTRTVRRTYGLSGIAPGKVFVLSRVTLGADVAVTSVILDAAKRRFPRARICFVGGRKNWELFAADPRIAHVPVSYRRGTLRDRLAHWQELRAVLSQPDSLIIDPDSRLTQLGLLPVCPEENYLFFESRSYGRDGDDSLPVLTRRWVAETLDIENAVPYIAPLERAPAVDHSGPLVTVSFGVGENQAKRIADPFEENLLRHLARAGADIYIDKGAGGEEAARVEQAIARAEVKVQTWEGSFAGFAGIIAQSDLYVGYDSAGQHVAAARGVPLVSIFAGFPTLRMFARWRPTGPGPIEVIRVDNPEPGRVFEDAAGAVSRLLGGFGGSSSGVA